MNVFRTQEHIVDRFKSTSPFYLTWIDLVVVDPDVEVGRGGPCACGEESGERQIKIVSAPRDCFKRLIPTTRV